MFRSVRGRLFASFALIVLVTLAAASIAFFARLGGYRDDLTAARLRQAAAPVYYNLALFPQNIREPGGGRLLRAELVEYLRVQSEETGMIVLLVDRDGSVIRQGTADEQFQSLRFDVPPPPVRGPDFGDLPQGSRILDDGSSLLYVTVPMPRIVRLQPEGVAAIVVALPESDARDVLGDLTPRLLFAGGVGLVGALLAALVLSAWLYRPLGRLADTIRAVSGGDYRRRAPASGPAELQELAHDVNAMADSVQSSQRTLREFLANVSHELKTPLTSIRGFSQAMLDGTLESREERDRAARVIDAEARRLLHLVGELMDLSRIESGQLSMHAGRVDTAELLSHVRDVFSLRSEESGTTLEVEDGDGVAVRGDFDRIEQVLGNLLDNAFRHTPPGGRIDAGARPGVDGLVEFYVRDTGAGIPPDELARVFDRFYRSDGEAGGSGLGLAISREIVRAHGGEIRAESSPGEGSVFVFTLPEWRE